MKWIKKGLIYCPDGRHSWAKHSAMTPTPTLLKNGIIRVYAGFRDSMGVSRICFVDVDANDPSKVIGVSKEPVLDIGEAGTFDDNGVILGDILEFGKELHMYYVGFQLVQKVKFLAFSGLAVSKDGGNSFVRVRRTPVLDRSDEGLFIRAIHSVLLENGIWKVWYAAGSKWVFIDGKPYPNYHIRYSESRDGLSFPQTGEICLLPEGNEYRIGRPRVYKKGGIYQMFFTKGTLTRAYVSGYAESRDGINWIRKDKEIGIDVSESGWDSQMLAYPSIIRYKDNVYMFYNGNNMGQTGFGYAVLKEW